MRLSEMQTILNEGAACWNNFEPSDARRTVWMRLVGHLPAELVRAAMDTHATQSVFPPTPADILRTIDKLKATVTGAPLSAEEAFMHVKKAVAFYGGYRQEQALSALPSRISAACRVLGWQSICESENEEALRAHFYRTYDAVADRERFAETMPPAVRAAIDSPDIQKALSGKVANLVQSTVKKLEAK